MEQTDQPVSVTVAQQSGDVFTHSPSIAKLAEALAKAQAQFTTLKASSVADAEKYKYNYADLASVLNAVRPALSAEGIAILQGVSMQRPSGSSSLIVLVETRLVHASGEWIATTLKLPSGEVAPQKVGSLTSYLRRYGLLALTACAAEDDDASSASTPTPRPQRPRQEQEPRAPKAEPTTARPVAVPNPVPANELPPAKVTKPRPEAKPVVDRHAPLSLPGTISAADRGLLFKIAKEQQVTERQVKSLIFALWGYTSTSQIRQGAEFVKVTSALEHPEDHGVTFAEDDALYERHADANPLPVDVTEGM